jgi:hypothetical protein
MSKNDSRPAVRLPSADKMLTALRSVNDNSKPVTEFYPLITRYAGQLKSPQDLEIILTYAIGRYTEGMPDYAAVSLHALKPRYIAALLKASEAS